MFRHRVWGTHSSHDTQTRMHRRTRANMDAHTGMQTWTHRSRNWFTVKYSFVKKRVPEKGGFSKKEGSRKRRALDKRGFSKKEGSWEKGFHKSCRVCARTCTCQQTCECVRACVLACMHVPARVGACIMPRPTAVQPTVFM